MVNRKSLCCTIVGLVLAILLEVWIKTKISLSFPIVVITILMYWVIFMVVIEAVWNAILKENVKDNILDAICTSSGGVAMTSFLMIYQNKETKSMLITIFCISFFIFAIVGCYRLGIAKKSEKNIEKTE